MIRYSDNNEILLSCSKEETGIIIIPEGIKKIEFKAFQDCYEILKIILPESLTEIGGYAFSNCSSLQEIILPKSIKKIPYGCFSGCINIHIIKLSPGILSIEYNAFENCRSLCRINLPDSITQIGFEAFKNCEKLSDILIPNGLDSILSKTFSGCESLIEVRIPKKVKSVGSYAFENCNSLTYVIIESTEAEIDPTAFVGCEQITRVYLDDFHPIKILSAFPDCSRIKYIAPLKDYSDGLSKDAVTLGDIQEKVSAELKFMSMYYRLFDMNLTQMKWSECPKRDKKSFKEPIDTAWEEYKSVPQSLSYLLSLRWGESSGIGLILGYNQYRALDVDISNHIACNYLYPDEGIERFINDVLIQLKLPIDYPWVVRSGNGYGFHVIFKCDDTQATHAIDSLSFEPGDYFCELGLYKLFYRMELRWCDHLVLPPSLHASGLQYRFRNGSLPSSCPSIITLSECDNVINRYCSERVFKKVSYKQVDFELTEIKKIKSRHDSYLSPHEHQTDTIAWLKEVDGPESNNSLALCYLLGKGVKSDIDLAIKYLEESDSQSATFNLLQLYSCGFLKFDVVKYFSLRQSLDEELFKEHMELLNINAKQHLPKIEKFLFFDTETTGLPKDYNAPSSDINNWPRIVQISWIVTDQFQHVLSKHNHIIKPNGFCISNESVSVHGITNDYATLNGQELNLVLDLFESEVNDVKFIIGHNIDFDKKVIEAEFYRANRELHWDRITSICTMKSSVDYCKLLNIYGYRYPKLQELYIKLFGTAFENAHNAYDDIIATERCFWEMVKRSIIIIPQSMNESDAPRDDLPF